MLKVRLVLRHAVWKSQRKNANEMFDFVQQTIDARHILQNDRMVNLQTVPLTDALKLSEFSMPPRGLIPPTFVKHPRLPVLIIPLIAHTGCCLI